MVNFDNQELALRVRNVTKKFAEQHLGIPHQMGQLARVTEVDPVELKALVWYPGDDEPLEVNLLSSLIPISVDADDLTYTPTDQYGSGALVWVEQINGKPYVTTVLSGLTYSQVELDTWHEMSPYLNSWINYGSGFATGAYRKTPDNVVMLRGLIKSGGATSNIFRLPEGYRPGGDSLLFGSISNNAIGRVDVQGDGFIVSNSPPNSTTFLSFNGISFYAEA